MVTAFCLNIFPARFNFNQGTRACRSQCSQYLYRLPLRRRITAPNKRSTAITMGTTRHSLYPPIQPYHTAFLNVSELHSVYYEISGNPDGIPICFVHGGPGGGTADAHRQFFDPNYYKIILFDQRGCGKSTPPSCLDENTTWDLIDDMERIREEAGVDRWILFGGSWGSTLSVAYAESHPGNVLGLILRGIFMSRAEEIRWLYGRDGAAMLYPEAFQGFLKGLPEHLRGTEDIMSTYYDILTGEVDTPERRMAANAWSWWEHTLSTFPVKGDIRYEDMGKMEYSDEENLVFARLECHYFMNGGFFREDGFLLKEKEIAKIRHIRTLIIQGRWDMVCPRKTAFDLAKVFGEKAETIIVENSGHSAFEPGIEQELLKYTDLIGKEMSSAGNGGVGG